MGGGLESSLHAAGRRQFAAAVVILRRRTAPSCTKLRQIRAAARWWKASKSRPPLIADRQPAEAGERAFDHPPGAPQALAALNPAPGGPSRRDGRDKTPPAAGVGSSGSIRRPLWSCRSLWLTEQRNAQ